jgi:hypothetical protein
VVVGLSQYLHLLFLFFFLFLSYLFLLVAIILPGEEEGGGTYLTSKEGKRLAPI